MGSLKRLRILCMILPVLLTRCGRVRDPGTMSEQLFAATEWMSDDDSYLVINEDMELTWYQTKEDLTDNYYRGRLQVYAKDEAYDFITEDLEEYGVTKEELDDVFRRSDHYSKDLLMCWQITFSSRRVHGVEWLSGEQTEYWFGFVLDNGNSLDLANMRTGTYYPFVKVENDWQSGAEFQTQKAAA